MPEEKIVDAIPQETTVEDATPQPIQEDATPIEVPQEEFNFELDYNHEKKVIKSKDELKDLAEKGLNLDKVREKLTQKDTENESLKSRLIEIEAQQLADNEGLELPDAKTKVMEKYEYQSLKAEKQSETETQTTEQRAVENRKSAVLALYGKYPDIKAEDIPLDKILSEWKNGTPEAFITVYEKHLSDTKVKTLEDKVAELEKQLNIDKVNKENAQTAVGSVTGGGATEDTEFTEETLETMTAQELAKDANWGKVKKLFKMK